jgi:hypothetical protein
MDPVLDGVISFRSSHDAIHAERAVRAAGFPAKLIPGPKELSPTCGVALSIQYADGPAILQLLEQKQLSYEALHAYRPANPDSWLSRLRGRRRKDPDGEDVT